LANRNIFKIRKILYRGITAPQHRYQAREREASLHPFSRFAGFTLFAICAAMAPCAVNAAGLGGL